MKHRLVGLLLMWFAGSGAAPVGTEFTYQDELELLPQPVKGYFDAGAVEPDHSMRVSPGMAFPLALRHTGSFLDPQLLLLESVDFGFARLSFYDEHQSFVYSNNMDMWTIAASITGAASRDRMNFNLGD
ncbi:MAG: hypothetical protein AB8B96_21655 [Lysobacterales bacterium]